MSRAQMIAKLVSAGHEDLATELIEITAAKKGSGIGDYKMGKPIKTIKSLKVGQLLANDNKKFNALNLMRITMIDTKRGIFYGLYVDPANPKKKRMSSDQEIAVWEFILDDGEYKTVK